MTYVVGDKNRDWTSDALSTNVIYRGYCGINDLTYVGTAKECLESYYKASKSTVADLTF